MKALNKAKIMLISISCGIKIKILYCSDLDSCQTVTLLESWKHINNGRGEKFRCTLEWQQSRRCLRIKICPQLVSQAARPYRVIAVGADQSQLK